MDNHVDYERIARIIRDHQGLEAHQAYYLKDAAQYQRIGPLVPRVSDALQGAFEVSRHVLDVGCGRGKTLLDNAHRFEGGTGLDESEEHMIAPAIRERDARGIHNVDFRVGKAASLPFDEAEFDMVFSERGPLGHSDVTLTEALRVLCVAGLIFIETGGDFDTLHTEKARLERHGVLVQVASSWSEELRFSDYYEFMRYDCSQRCYMGQTLPLPEDREAITHTLRSVTDGDGRIAVPYRMIWVGGTKSPQPADPSAFVQTDASRPSVQNG